MSAPGSGSAPEPDAPDAPDGSGVPHRLVRNLLVAIVVFVAGGVVLAGTGDGGGEPERVVRPGPAPGTDLDRYRAERLAALEEARGVRDAVVSFTEYRSAEEVGGADLDGTGVDGTGVDGTGVDGTGTLAGTAPGLYLVAAPGAEPEVTADVRAWREDTLAQARREVVELSRYLEEPEGIGEEFLRQYEVDLAAARATVEGLEEGVPVVFGVVVRAEAADLRALAGADGARLVDPVPEGASGQARGVRPEETAVAGRPPRRP